MDAVARAIKKGLHISNIKKLRESEWQDFEKDIIGKKVFLLGAGACAGFFWDKYGTDVVLTGVLDNAQTKQGKMVEDVIAEAVFTHNMCIESVSVLNDYVPGEVVVLITSTNYYEELAIQLEKMGITSYYSLLNMEANKRLQMTEEFVSRTWSERREHYIEKCSRLPIEPKKIVFWAFNTYTDHGKYITEQLLNIRSDLDIVWLMGDQKLELPEKVRYVSMREWKKSIYEIETARMWIHNAIFMEYYIKRPEQIFIETKHWASVTLKRFYLDASTITDIPENVAQWKQCFQQLDYIITGSDFDTESCRRGFDFHKEVIRVGSPRSDVMFRGTEMKEKICRYYQVDTDSHFLLYAPTYRYKKGMEQHVGETRNIELDFEAVRCAMKQKFGGNWLVILRLHPGFEKDMDRIERPDYVLDGSNYADGLELASASDVMITDYSSIMFEPAFVKKPVFLFATDREDYIDKEYDLLIDYDSLPFPIAENNEELMQNIKQFDLAEYEKNIEVFLDKYGVHEDGHASERAAAFISDLVEH